MESVKPDARATPQMEADKLDKMERRKSGWSLFSPKKELEAEMTQKMESVVQDTLLKNMQLHVMSNLRVWSNQV